jgi:chorismate synthase
LKHKFEINVVEQKNSYRVFVKYLNSDPVSVIREYSGKNTVGRVIAGIINMFLKNNVKEKKCNTI